MLAGHLHWEYEPGLPVGTLTIYCAKNHVITSIEGILKNGEIARLKITP